MVLTLALVNKLCMHAGAAGKASKASKKARTAEEAAEWNRQKMLKEQRRLLE